MLSPRDIEKREEMPYYGVLQGMRQGTLPCIWIGPRTPRCPVEVWERFLRGDPVAKHYFKGKPKPKNEQENENAESAEPVYRFE
ncbi:hypothetical protein [Candidatus Thiodiazotropha endoloripes]|uniref:hypothetical protein n=1 Tax=Candidatus Thiodiazotropha endoloripes TaxID=1818881 RepID=UPI001391B1FC|nr:hypothetical protein [Candidatus Thiodiazotropha endoloripes]